MTGKVRGAGALLGRAADLVFLTRPLLLCLSTAFFLAGAAGGLNSPIEALELQMLLTLGPGLLLLLLVVASSFVINRIYDVRSDALNEKNFLLTSGRVRGRDAALFCGALSFGALMLALKTGPPSRELGLAGLALGFAYSVPPVRLKGRLVADMLANGLGFGLIAFALGRLAVLPHEDALMLRASPYVLAMCAIFLNTTIPDEAGDRAAGDRTTCVVFGRRPVALAAALMLGAAAAIGFCVGEAPCAIAAALSLPAFIAVAVEPAPAASIVASQFSGRAFYIVVGLAVPPLLVLGGAVYGISKVYYARRFGLDYPRMEGASARERTCPGPQGSHMNKALRGGS